MQTPEEIKEYLAKIRKNVAEARELVSQVELRRVETDRLLAAQGLTREEVMNMRFTREQRLAVNEELRRRGLPPIEDDEAAYDFDAATAELRTAQAAENAPGAAGDDPLAERRRKFGNFMQEYRL